jgi:hypothetical protein
MPPGGSHTHTLTARHVTDGVAVEANAKPRMGRALGSIALPCST